MSSTHGATREEVAKYVEEHQLEPRLSEMLNALARERPSDAAAFMAGYLAGGAGASGAGAGGAAAPPPKPKQQAGVMALLSAMCARAQQAAFPGSEPPKGVPIAETTKPEHGEYQNNGALPLYASLKGRPGAPPSPRAVAEALKERMAAEDAAGERMISKLEIAGPGFINIFLRREWVEARVLALACEGALPPVLTPCRAVVDFSSPNVAKEMHVGHLRSTIIGETICRVLEFTGHEVERVNHVGDWGTQFGMLIAHMKREHPAFFSEEGAPPPPIADLQAFYKAAKLRFDAEEDFKAEAQASVVRLQAGEPTSRRAWEAICDASRAEFSKVYRRLGITLTEVGESFYNRYIPAVVASLQRAGQVVAEGGAQVIFPPQSKHPIPLIVVKSDGGFNYDSTDLAAAWYRLCERRADWLIYVVDAGQGPHFDLIFDAARNAGWTRPHTRLQHVQFGLVCGEDGKRFKTRSGEVVRLVDLLDEAKQRTLASFKERVAEARAKDARAAGGAPGAEAEPADASEIGGNTSFLTSASEAELERAAEVLGYSAVKYADLKSNRISNYTFSYERMLALTGNTAVYLIYAHARVCSIVAKAGVDVDALVAARTPIALTHPAELAFGAAVVRFPDRVEDVLRELCPSVLCEYLYDMSAKLNVFVRECRVIGVPQTPSRLMLCCAGLNVMRTCFELLGMEYLHRI